MPDVNNPSAAPSPAVAQRYALGRAAPAAAGLTGADLVRILRRRWIMITVILLLFTVVFSVGSVLWRSMMPQYSARASVTVTMPERSALRMLSPLTNAEMLDRHKQTVAGLIKTRQVLLAALNDREMRNTLWFTRFTANDPEMKDALSELTDEISIGLQPNNNYINIGMSMYCSTAEQKTQLPTIVNAVARAFVDEVNREQREQRDEQIRQLKATRTSLEGEIRKAREDRDRLLANAVVPAMRTQTNSISMELDQLLRANNDLQMAKANIEKAIEGFTSMQLAGTIEQNPQIQEALDRDTILRGLEAELSASKSTLEILVSKFGPDHRQRQDVTSKIASLENEIVARRNELVKLNEVSAMSAMQQQRMQITEQLVENGERQRALAGQRRDLNETLLVVERYEQQMNELAEQRNNISDKIIDLEQLRENDVIARLFSAAMIPLEPSGPKLAAWIPMGVLLGLAVGIGLAMLLELSDSTVKTPTDITSRAGLPLLAMLPDADDMSLEIADYRLVCRQLEHTTVNEAFRELRSNLEFSGPPEMRRSLLVTSPSPLDGRTTVAANLAITIARTGRRVLLVDANFRRPEASGLFSLETERGLSDVLSGQAPWAECVSATDEANLFVLQAGKLPPNTNELLSSELAAKFYAEIVGAYDQVIFDGPPATLLTDAWVLANRLDGVILVTRANENTLGIVQRSRALLERSGASIIGCVINGIQTTSGGYLRKNYDAFSAYHEAAPQA